MAFTNKHTQGEWKVRFMNREGSDDNECDFFVEAPEPKNQIGKIELLMDDYGEHNGYSREQRLADAKLVSAAPELRQCVEMFHDYLNNTESGRNSIAMQAVKMALSKAGVEFNNKPIDV